MMKVKEKPMLHNFLAGGASGFLTGIILGPLEYAKVKQQVSTKNISIYQIIHKNWKQLPKSSISFGINFGIVCALEFSVNEKISDKFGVPAGLIASSITGASFLTPADHIMYRMDKEASIKKTLYDITYKNPFALWKGFPAMMFREIISITNILILGPELGKKIKSIAAKDTNNYSDEIFWKTVGRYPANIIGTIITHPFDSYTTYVQKHYYENCKNSNFKESPSNFSFKHCWKGLVPRLLLAPIGLTLVGTWYEIFLKEINDCKRGVPEKNIKLSSSKNSFFSNKTNKFQGKNNNNIINESEPEDSSKVCP